MTDTSQAAARTLRVSSLQVVVKEETPFLPKVAFVLITLASLGGATFTGMSAGLTGVPLLWRWLALWAVALAGGFLVWRLAYLRSVEADTDPARVEPMYGAALTRATTVGRWVAPIVAVGAVGPIVTPYLGYQPVVRGLLVAAMAGLAVSLVIGVHRRAAASAGIGLVLLVVLLWAYADAGTGWQGWVRVAHLIAFTLWLGGALWNIAVAMPVGRQHANVDAVLAGANQLDRFRWVVRFALPTIIVTGLLMAGVYRHLPMTWWTGMPGVLIPLKVLAIVALVVVFITCPLFRHCSPVQGVCNIDDLDEEQQ